MFVKGTAYIARRNLLIRELGEDRWNMFLQAYLKENPGFPKSILTVTDIDVLEFIKLNDAVIDRFYRGDKKTYFRFGEMSAEWALRGEGPYKSMRIARDYRGFVEGQASVFRMYYSEGKAKSIMKEGVVEYWCDVPKPYRHVYLEYTPIGYLRRGLELTGCRVINTQCVKGFSKGDEEIHYRLPLET